jgi:hypothetical protein
MPSSLENNTLVKWISPRMIITVLMRMNTSSYSSNLKEVEHATHPSGMAVGEYSA